MAENKNKKPKSRGGEGGGSSRIDSLVITFKVLCLDQGDQEDDDNDADYGYDDNDAGGWFLNLQSTRSSAAPTDASASPDGQYKSSP